jgi:hypothetical protein
MQRLVAIRPFKYGTRHFVAGDAVEVSDRHALLLRAGQQPKARLAGEEVLSKASSQARKETGLSPTNLEAEDIDVLRARAAHIGIKVDMRWGMKRIQEEIAKS